MFIDPLTLLKFKFELDCVTRCVGTELFYDVLLGVYSMASADPNSSWMRLPLCSSGPESFLP